MGSIDDNIIPKKMADGLRGFCDEMEELGIPCTITIRKDGHLVMRFGKEKYKNEGF
jgi:hypothetical protein